MKKWTCFIVVGLIIFSACSESKSEGDLHPKSSQKEQIYADVNGNSKLTVDVKGMECVMACGGSITQALKETGAVKSVDFDFKMAREFNTATILYDSTKISQEKIIHLIEELNNHQFTTKNAIVETMEQTTSQNDNSSRTSGSYISPSSMLATTEIVQSIRKSIVDLLVSTIIRH